MITELKEYMVKNPNTTVGPIRMEKYEKKYNELVELKQAEAKKLGKSCGWKKIRRNPKALRTLQYKNIKRSMERRIKK